MRNIFVGLVMALAASLGAGCEPQLEIVLVRGPDLEGDVPFVKFQVRELGETEADEFGPFSSSGIPDEQFAPLTPGTVFYVDVIGCKGAEPEECVDPNDFIARGCSDFISLQRDAPTTTVTIEVHKASDGAELCPPEEPQQ